MIFSTKFGVNIIYPDSQQWYMKVTSFLVKGEDKHIINVMDLHKMPNNSYILQYCYYFTQLKMLNSN